MLFALLGSGRWRSWVIRADVGIVVLIFGGILLLVVHSGNCLFDNRPEITLDTLPAFTDTFSFTAFSVGSAS